MRFLFASLVFLVFTSHGRGEIRVLDFSMADGSEFSAALMGAGEDELVVLSTSVFEESAWSLRTDRLMRAESASDPIGNLREQDFVFELRDQSRFVGQPVGFDQGRLRVATIELGEVEFAVDRLVRVVRAPAIEHRQQLLEATRHLWRGDGWSFRDGELVSDDRGESETAFRSTVGELGLDEQFHLRLELACAGQPSVQMLLGDRAEDGGGQGRGRRGSSRSLSPEEERLTQLEWFGRGVSLARRTSSVADMALFDVGSSERLSLDVYVDQKRGLIAAFQEGQLVGSVELSEGQPSIHSSLTLISRGDSVALKSLEVFRWSGTLPESRSVKPPFTQSTGGEVRVGATIDANTKWETLRWMEWRRTPEPYPSPCLEFLWPDGCRVAGEFALAKDGTFAVIRTPGGLELKSHPQRMSRLIRVGTKMVPPASAELRSWRSMLFGELVAADDGELAWQASFAKKPLRLSPKADAEIRWKREPRRSEKAIVLEDGQRVTGTLGGIARGVVSFEPTVSQPVELPLGRVARLEIRPMSIDSTPLEKMLTLPRRQESDPPTHLVVSTAGDAVRGKLVSLDSQEVQVEVRSRTRKLPTDRVASIFRLATSETRASNEREPWKLLVTTLGGDELRFNQVRFAEAESLEGRHDMLGDCRIGTGQLKTIVFGKAAPLMEEALQLLPAKQPRTFEDESSDGAK